MQTSTHTLSPSARPRPPAVVPTRRVVDAPIRMFHALFALSFALAYLTADGEAWRALHVTLGYTMAGLLGFRLLYGLFGPRHAGLAALWRKLAGAPAWMRSAAAALGQARPGDIHWRQGQNLLMALAVGSLLALVVPLTLSGYATYDDWGDFLGGDWIEDVHEFFGEAMLAVVLTHLAIVVGSSVLRRKNQALPMLTGRVEGAGPDLVKHNHAWLAALLLLAVLAFGGWQWQQYPNGLLPAAAGDAAPRDGDGHDDD